MVGETFGPRTGETQDLHCKWTSRAGRTRTLIDSLSAGKDPVTAEPSLRERRTTNWAAVTYDINWAAVTVTAARDRYTGNLNLIVTCNLNPIQLSEVQVPC